MMANPTTNEIVAAVNEKYRRSETYEWNGLEIEIKKNISMEEMFAFVNLAVSNCFNEETGEYRPEVKDFLIRCATLEFYAGIALPEDVKDKFDIVYASNLFGFVLERINLQQFYAITEAIDKKVDNMVQANIVTLNKQMYEVIKALESFSEQFAGMFDNIDMSAVANMAEALSNGFDEEKLVKAITRHRASRAIK